MKIMKKVFLFAIVLPLLLCAAPGHGAQNGVSDAAIEDALKKILRQQPNLVLDVLRQNSEAVLEIAQQGSNLRRKHLLEAQWREDMKKPKETRLAGRPVLGNKDAKVTIVAFSDFTCNFCQQASRNLAKIMDEYGDKLSLVFKHLPLDEKGPGALASAYFIAIAMQDEAKAWEFYKQMFANRDALLSQGEPYIKKTAQNLGVDMKKLQKTLNGSKVKEIMEQDQEDGQKLGVEGTPYFLVNNLVVRGALPPELFRNAVDMALSEKQ